MTVATSSLLSGSILDEQIRLEQRAIDDGVARYNENAAKSIKRGDGAALKPAERMLLHWYEPLRDAIAQDQREIKRGAPAMGAKVWGEAYGLVSPEKLAVITLHEAIGECMKFSEGVLVSRLTHAIGRAVVAEINLQILAERDAETRARRKERLAAGEDKKTVYEQEREAIKDLDRRFRSVTPSRLNWWANKTIADSRTNKQLCTQLGGRLLYHLCDVCNLASDATAFELAFHRVRRPYRGKRAGFIVMDHRAHDIIERGHEVRSLLRPRFLPMVVAPYPWSTHTQGGYVKVRTPFVSKPTKEQKAAIEKADLSTVYEALTAISSVGWRINRQVLDVIKQVYESGGGELGLPHKSNVPNEPRPAGYDGQAPLRERWARVDHAEKKAYKRVAAKIIEENVRRKAMRREFASKLDIAERFADHDAIYFPHQFDFRGRLYAIPIHLNHQGDDVCRGLLEFAETKVPGPEGERWLKIHAASIYGIDKVGFPARIAWVDAHMDEIRACVADPLNTDFWTHADESESGARDGKPWQFLAACFALVDPNGAGARIPIQVDGTCNGLQHYTALGRDERAARAVNMAGPADEPESVYNVVADETDGIVRRDMGEGNAIARTLLERVGRVNKPLVKQPVMTKSYGVTDVGARDQVAVQLKQRGYADEELYRTSRYLSQAVMEGIGTVCQKAAEIMEWMQECATLIAREGRLVTWTSPVGFPVVQPYRRWTTMEVHTVLQTVVVLVEDETAPVHVQEQVNGSAPNIVHSFDAAHLMLTAIDCHNHGVTLAAVHDSYWSHAATMTFANHAIREHFVIMHEQPLLEKLVAEWRKIHPDIEFPDPPKPGTLDIRLVIPSPYCFH